MYTVSEDAAAQIKVSLSEAGNKSEPLRVAVEKTEDGTFHYQMGFDSSEKFGDTKFNSEGVELVVDAASAPLVSGMLIDYIDMDGSMEFVFMNPNDPKYKAPQT
ncbi:MAG TPA: iron-sulfur cluster assembly accessory protein [Leucothrix mucor]|nr:iron-sulfur cluster assembly accessory protein [Leucothrix mucor]